MKSTRNDAALFEDYPRLIGMKSDASNGCTIFPVKSLRGPMAPIKVRETTKAAPLHWLTLVIATSPDFANGSEPALG